MEVKCITSSPSLCGPQVYKSPPFYPPNGTFDPQLSFGEQDVDFLVENGFSMVRLFVAWPGVEPKRGQYNRTYLEVKLCSTQHFLDNMTCLHACLRACVCVCVRVCACVCVCMRVCVCVRGALCILAPSRTVITCYHSIYFVTWCEWVLLCAPFLWHIHVS